MSEICVQVNKLKKSFNGRTVVDDVSFEVEKGTAFGLLGHNGAGKSTTIEMILGLKKPDSGNALVNGLDVEKNKKKSFEKIGVQLQSSNYQAGLSVKDIIIERSALYKNANDYQELLKRFGLWELRNNNVNRLSGGEKQKLSVALALVGKPEVIFLDELTTGLDVAARREVWRILMELKKNGMTLFITTHYMEEAEKLCDKICLLKEGKQITLGTVKEVVDASPYNNLEEAYLWYMGEKVEL